MLWEAFLAYIIDFVLFINYSYALSTFPEGLGLVVSPFLFESYLVFLVALVVYLDIYSF